ncbi:BTAD domain-containing putative transcriptional regulator [Amycolatopsis pigmentata]|uniref:BTAD domain-containing putative transcriptional regulator n=1 Tax=Amycolatopsis pigmentata TaxID=450801 RepID=A0ABW5G019_9PSEU
MTGHSGSGLRFEVLGSVRGWRGDEQVDLGSAHRRAVLAILAISAGKAVSRHDLIDALWGEFPPASAGGSIYTYISGLRRVLEPGRAPRSSGHVLASVGSGYSLQIEDEQLDLHRFHALRASGVRHMKEGHLPEALEDLDAALGLWHGDALSGLPGPFAAAQRTKLGELRLTTVETRAEVLLDLSRRTEVIAELTALCQEHPLRERLRALLMRALHQDGRTAEALEVFAEAREILVDTSGIEPGPELRRLHQKLLSGTAAGPAPVTALPLPVSATLSTWQPDRPEVFTGREDELNLLAAAVHDVLSGQGGVVWLEGEPGIGKTALLAEALSGTAVTGARVRWVAAQEIDSGRPAQLIRDCLGLGAAECDIAHVLDVVERMLADGPLILVADDFQWADDASLGIWWRLAQLLDRLPLLLVSASRPIPRRETVERMRHRLLGVGRAISLRPLSEVEVMEFAEKLLRAPLPPALRARIDDASGNPLYVKEMVPATASDEPDPRLCASPRPPARLVARINDHLTFLTSQTRSMLQWATLLGRRFTFSDLAATVGRQPVELISAVEEALSAGVLVADGQSLRFRHKIVEDSLYEKTPSAMRAALHRQFAETLAAAGAPAAQVAGQLAACATVTDPWVGDWLSEHIGIVAAEKPRLAVELLRQVIGSGPRESAQSDEFAVMLARLLFWLGREPEAEARSVIARTTDPARAAEMRWILAYAYHRRGRDEAARSEVDSVLADPRVTGTWRARHDLLRTVLDGAVPDGTFPEMIDLGEHRYLDDDTHAALGTVRGEGRFGSRVAGRARKLAPYRALPAEIHVTSAVHHYWTGDWQAAMSELDAVIVDETGYASYLPSDTAVLAHSLAALITTFRDDQDAAQRHLYNAVTHAMPDSEVHPGTAVLLIAKSVLAYVSGNPEEALEALSPLTGLPHVPSSLYGWLPRAARIATEFGDDECVARVLRAAETGAPAWFPDEHKLVRDYCHALTDDDPDDLLRVATTCRNTHGFTLMCVRAFEDAGWLLARHGRYREARETVTTAVEGYRKIGATWNVRRMHDMVRFLGYPVAAVAGTERHGANGVADAG